ncbi:histidine phosphatase family protein [Nonomuraea sp. NPDC050536]|uniref:histidine phosphatase family protein n=1 Tax=Nonomuraea sp. NPDC050536 TaxID=3364366 RepID=UPI0037CAC695
MRAACFPDPDSEADPASLARAAARAGALTGASDGMAWVGPGRAAGQTAVALGFEPCVVPALGEADFGRWTGLPYAKVAEQEPEALARWLSDPDAAPHGGESLGSLAARVADWLDGVRDVEGSGGGVVVCDAGVVRAAIGRALGLDPVRAGRFDVAPLSTTGLAVSRDGWRVAHVNRRLVP